MQMAVHERGAVMVIEPSGSIAGRAAMEFEREVVSLLGKGHQCFALGFAGVDLITSAGIRVLMLLAQRTRKGGGGTILFALSDHVRSVLDVAGLMSQFQIVESEAAALAKLRSRGAKPTAAPASKLTRLARRLLDAPNDEIATVSGDQEPSALTREVRRLVAPSRAPDADSH